MSHFHLPLINSPLRFPLERHGYFVTGVLNNKNRWHTKLVCKITDEFSKEWVSTTYRQVSECQKLIKTVNLLRRNYRLVPQIAKLYPQHNTVICDFVGEFLSEFLLENPNCLEQSLMSVSAYLESVNAINQTPQAFTIPPTIEMIMQLPKEHLSNFDFLPKVKNILPRLENGNVQFIYGCGVQDPHIWNFRILKTSSKIQALTTDFDYFSDQVNYFWELGYFYATFRWLKKASTTLVKDSENILSLIGRKNPKSEFMFWLGALSSYCGYEDSLRNLAQDFNFEPLKEQYLFIRCLDNKVSCLAEKILDGKKIKKEKCNGRHNEFRGFP